MLSGPTLLADFYVGPVSRSSHATIITLYNSDGPVCHSIQCYYKSLARKEIDIKHNSTPPTTIDATSVDLSSNFTWLIRTWPYMALTCIQPLASIGSCASTAIVCAVMLDERLTKYTQLHHLPHLTMGNKAKAMIRSTLVLLKGLQAAGDIAPLRYIKGIAALAITILELVDVSIQI